MKFGLIICGVLLCCIANAETYTVTLPTVTGATVAPTDGSSSPVNYGDNYSFTVTLDAAYNQSTIVVKANDEVLTPTSDVYTILNITENQTIIVEGVQINAYTVIFCSNGGSNVKSQTIDYGGLVAEPDTPTKDCYNFDGWYSDSELTTAWDFETNTITSNIRLYAKWYSEITQTKICRKGTSILICEDSTGFHYIWGYMNKDDDENAMPIKSDTTNFQYFDFYYEFQQNIDTSEYKYFVEIIYTGKNCPIRTFYIDDKTSSVPPTPNINAYPNPTKQHLSVTLNKDINGSYTVLLLNTFGQTVFSKQYAEYRKNEVLSVDFNLPAGIYLLAVETKEDVFTSKVVIE